MQNTSVLHDRTLVEIWAVIVGQQAIPIQTISVAQMMITNDEG